MLAFVALKWVYMLPAGYIVVFPTEKITATNDLGTKIMVEDLSGAKAAQKQWRRLSGVFLSHYGRSPRFGLCQGPAIWPVR